MYKFNKTIAVTGGIGSGKSTVCKIIRENGFKVIDTDEITRKLRKPGGKAYLELIKLFGKDIIQKDKRLNRNKIKQKILSNPSLKKELENLLHPLVLKEVEKEIQLIRRKNYNKYIFVEVPLLFEARWDKFFPHILLIKAPIEKRIERVKQTRNMNSYQILSFIKSQLPDHEKEKRSTWIINNDKSLEELKTQVKTFLKELESTYESDISR